MAKTITGHYDTPGTHMSSDATPDGTHEPENSAQQGPCASMPCVTVVAS